MNILQLHNELIPNISFYLPIFDINYLICSHSKFSNSFDFDWSQYLNYHFGVNVNLSKNDVKLYSKYFIEELYSYYFIEAILANPNNLSSSDIDYYQYKFSITYTQINKKLLLTSNIIKLYKNDILYNQLIKNNKPIFLSRGDLIADSIHGTIVKIKEVLTRYLGNIIIIERDIFGVEILSTIASISNLYRDQFLVIMI